MRKKRLFDIYRSHKYRQIYIILLFFLFSLVISACLISGWNLVFTRPPSSMRKIELADLFLEKTSFPDGWDIEGNGPYEACNASPLGSGCHTYGEYMQYIHIDGQLHARETIYQFQSTEHAKSSFSDLVNDEFITWPDMPDWQESTSIAIDNLEADNIYLACLTLDYLEDCQIAAQYEKFVVIFTIRWQSPDLYLLESLIGEIDNRMTSILNP